MVFRLSSKRNWLVVVVKDKQLQEGTEYFGVPQLIAGTIALLQRKKQKSKGEILESYLWPFEKGKFIFMLRVVGFKITFFRFKPTMDFINAVIRGLRPNQKTIVDQTDLSGKSLLDPNEREMIVKGLINIKNYIKENF